jgi:hypothetical protein
MNYVLRETAKSVVVAMSDFITQGRLATPPTEIEGSFDRVMESQRQHNAAIAQVPVTAEMLNALTLEKRIAWMMNIFTTDERYACAWNIAEKAMKAAPINFPLAIEQVWQKRATKNW